MTDTPRQRVAVIGATGQVGMPLSRELHRLGHEVVAISRGRSASNTSRLDTLASLGIQPVFQEDLTDIDRLAGISLKGQS